MCAVKAALGWWHAIGGATGDWTLTGQESTAGSVAISPLTVA
jgi:hypothetical protein